MASSRSPVRGVPEDRQCGHCRRRISLVESTIRCRCGLAFCERHRAAESHECQFDWRQMQRDKVARENPKVIQASSKLGSSKVTPVAGFQVGTRPRSGSSSTASTTQCLCSERSTQLLHLMGFLLVAAMSFRGLLLCVSQGAFILFLRQLVLGYFLAMVLVHGLPQVLSLPASSCRFCVFSWDVLTKPQWCLAAECQKAKEHLNVALAKGQHGLKRS
ncbi:unnamed protein product [Effrenium voratum]|uniref:AN1-type domain-containing protein n=1 Tax=Effrenium voratum TaxID=2562239 RepID=A0AA36I1G8_9DINO|nr:unnamed protein product [Effrenium voratum]